MRIGAERVRAAASLVERYCMLPIEDRTAGQAALRVMERAGARLSKTQFLELMLQVCAEPRDDVAGSILE